MYCQKCRTPLKLDSSLEDLSPTALKLLVEASSRTLKDAAPSSSSIFSYTPEQNARYHEAASGTPKPIINRGSPPAHDGSVHRNPSSSTQTNPDMSFIMLTQSQAALPPQAEPQNQSGKSGTSSRRRSRNGGSRDDGPLSHKMETTARLFEVLSSRSDIDHPICVECTEMLTEGMEKRLANATKERDAYAEFLRKAQANMPTEEERQQADHDIKAVKEQKTAAFSEMEQLEAEKAELEQELASLDIEAREMDREEEAFWQERNAFSRVLNDYQDQRDSLNLRLEHDSKQLEKLRRTNVYNDTFNISRDKDDFATINGLRLGRKPGKNPDWTEVNAAWGQALLLLVVVAEKLKYSFKGYQLQPMGSASTIDKLEPNPPSQKNSKQNIVSLTLYNTTEMSTGFGLLHRQFDAAMIAFLECLRQLGSHIEKLTADTEHPKSFPHTVKKDKINDLSVKLGNFNADDGWARACKSVLTGCKWCLAYTSSAEVPGSTTNER